MRTDEWPSSTDTFSIETPFSSSDTANVSPMRVRVLDLRQLENGIEIPRPVRAGGLRPRLPAGEKMLAVAVQLVEGRDGSRRQRHENWRAGLLRVEEQFVPFH